MAGGAAPAISALLFPPGGPRQPFGQEGASISPGGSQLPLCQKDALAQVRVTQVGATQIRADQVGPVEAAAPQVGGDQHRHAEIPAREPRAPQVLSRKAAPGTGVRAAGRPPHLLPHPVQQDVDPPLAGGGVERRQLRRGQAQQLEQFRDARARLRAERRGGLQSIWWSRCTVKKAPNISPASISGLRQPRPP